MDYKMVVFSTPTLEDAKRLSRMLLTNKLVSSVSAITNTWTFEEVGGVIDEAQEVMVMALTTDDKLAEATRLIHSKHGMDVPKILLLDIIGGSKPFLEKMRERLTPDSESEDIDWSEYGFYMETVESEEQA